MKNWRNFDWFLIGLPMLLTGFGIVMLWQIADWAPHVSKSTPVHQVAYLIVGLVALWGMTVFDYRTLAKFVWILYGVMVMSLVGVSLIGQNVQGGQRWISVGSIQLQPSESAKLVVILTLAKFLSDRESKMSHLSTFLGSLVIAGVPALLVLAQPDFGTAMVIGSTWFAIAIMASTPPLYMAATLGSIAIASPFAWIAVLKPYQRERFTGFLNPAADRVVGWDIIHTRIAVGSGGTWGEWFSRSTQARLNFLGAQTSDFIFPVIAEQIGFIGLVILLVVFTLYLLRIARVAFLSADLLGRLIASGILAMFLFQTFVNVGMNIGILPITGIPLPLLSYGGSSLITCLAAVGILESILIRNQKLIFSTGASIL